MTMGELVWIRYFIALVRQRGYVPVGAPMPFHHSLGSR
jgi:hypothetical protein